MSKNFRSGHKRFVFFLRKLNLHQYAQNVTNDMYQRYYKNGSWKRWLKELRKNDT